MPERWTGPADIAWCDEHGLHGARDRCFECSKPVEQIRMLPLDELLERIQAELHSEEDGCIRLDGPLGQAIADEAGSWSLEFVTPEELALGICSWLKDFGPREDEGGEGVKPDDPPDGAESPQTSQGQPPPAPDAEDQEGAESSRVGGPSDIVLCNGSGQIVESVGVPGLMGTDEFPCPGCPACLTPPPAPPPTPGLGRPETRQPGLPSRLWSWLRGK